MLVDTGGTEEHKYMIEFLAHRRRLSFGSSKPAVTLGLAWSVNKRKVSFAR